MSACIAVATPSPVVAPVAASVARDIPLTISIPVVDLANDSPTIAQQIVSNAAQSTGLAYIRNVPTQPNFAAIQSLFDTLYQSPLLMARLNSTYPKRGVIKLAGKLTDDESVDDKVTLDLSAQRLQYLQDDTLRTELGLEFETAVKFFEAVEEKLVPLVLQATSSVISTAEVEIDLRNIHREGNNNFRLTDYHHAPASRRHGCGDHRDYGTATLIFQDGSGGLEFQDSLTKEWLPIPGNETVLMWGWCGHVLSGGKIRTVRHRVKTIDSARRNTAVCFIAPDLNTPLQPMVDSAGRFADIVRNGTVTVEMFKEVMGKKWRRREGNDKDGVADGMTQDEEVIKFLYGSA
jgi:isopenicillin N synthase-like dioxygenase